MCIDSFPFQTLRKKTRGNFVELFHQHHWADIELRELTTATTPEAARRMWRRDVLWSIIQHHCVRVCMKPRYTNRRSAVSVFARVAAGHQPLTVDYSGSCRLGCTKKHSSILYTLLNRLQQSTEIGRVIRLAAQHHGREEKPRNYL